MRSREVLPAQCRARDAPLSALFCVSWYCFGLGYGHGCGYGHGSGHGYGNGYGYGLGHGFQLYFVRGSTQSRTFPDEPAL